MVTTARHIGPPKRKYGNTNNFFNSQMENIPQSSIKNKRHYDNIVKTTHKVRTWGDNRKFSDYFKILSRPNQEILKTDVIDYLAKRYAITKKPINVLDEGMGFGHFLVEIKKQLRQRGVPCYTTGITLGIINSKSQFFGGRLLGYILGSIGEPQKMQKDSEIKREYVRNVQNIDRVVYGKLENYNPEKKFDLITSVYGGVNYSSHIIGKEVLLKLAYSLNVGGILYLVIDKSKYYEDLNLLQKSLKPSRKNIKPYEELLDSDTPEESIKKSMAIINYHEDSAANFYKRFEEGVIASFKKRGFAIDRFADGFIIKRLK